jgi:hypothetical protein
VDPEQMKRRVEGMAQIQKLFKMQQMMSGGKPSGNGQLDPKFDKAKYAKMMERFRPRQFWDTQPVPKLSEGNFGEIGGLRLGPKKSFKPAYPSGPISKKRSVKDIRKEPYDLPPQFEWCTINLKDDVACHEVTALF